MNIDNIENGHRINCNGVHGTVIGKRSTRNQRFALVKMDNGFTLKLDAETLPETNDPVSVVADKETARLTAN
jgi:hypothetical protein